MNLERQIWGLMTYFASEDDCRKQRLRCLDRILAQIRDVPLKPTGVAKLPGRMRAVICASGVDE